MTQKILEVGQKMTKNALMGRWPQPKPTFNVWNKEKKEWDTVALKKRLKDRKFEVTEVKDVHGTTLIRALGKTQKIHWVEFSYGRGSKKEEIIMAPHIIPIHMVKPEPKDTAETPPKDEEGEKAETKEAPTLKETESLK